MIHNDLASVLLVATTETLAPVEAALAGLGFRLVREATAGGALERLRAADFAALLLDAGRPGLDLAGLARGRGCRVPILFLDAGDDFPAAEAYGIEGVDHLARPVVPAALRAKVSALVDRHLQARRPAFAEDETARHTLEALMEHVPEGIVITGGPPDFPLKQASRHGLVMAGVDVGVDGVLGLPAGRHQPAWGLHRPDGSPLPREDAPLYRAAVEGAVTVNQEVLIRRRDGCEVNVLVNAAPVRDRDGRIVGAINCWRDVTELKAGERALAEARRRSSAALQAGEVGAYYWDMIADRVSGDRNFGDIFGILDDRRTSAPIAEFLAAVHPDDRPGLVEAVRRSIEDEAPFHTEYRIVGPAKERWVLARGAVERDADGAPIGWFGVLVDITSRKGYERALAEAEERFRIVARATNDAIWDWDQRTDEVWWNDGVTSLFGYRAEAIGTDVAWWYDHIHPDDRERVVSGIHEVIDRGLPAWSDEYRFRKADGGYAVVLDRGFAVREGGKTSRLVGAMQDVTGQRRSEAQLREGERKYRALFESIDEGFCVVEVLFDASGRAADYRFLLVNPVFGPQTGLHDAVGRSMRELVPDLEGHWFETYGRVATTREPVRFQGYAEALGRYFDVFAFPAGAPETRNVAILFRDVTAGKRAEESMQFLADAGASLAELVDYQSTLRRIANLAVGGFADWCVVDMIAEGGRRERLAVTAAEPDDVASARAADAAFRSADDPAGMVPHVLQTGEPEVVFDLEDLDPATAAQGAGRIRGLKSLGVRSYLCVPLRSRGRVIGGITFLSSSRRRRFGAEELRIGLNLAERVTVAIENAQLYRELQEQDRRKDEFLATLAHELRNPLAPLKNGLQILRMAGVGAEAAARTLDMMDRQLGHVTHLVDDLMDVARVSSGKVALRIEPLSLRAVVDAAVETSRQVIESGGHELVLRAPHVDVRVEGDRTRLVQVLANLLNNAAKYTPRGGRITLGVAADAGLAVVEVADTGVGLAPEMIPLVFDMFTQVGTSLERSQGGLGIGLTLVKRLVEMHGGSVAAASPGPGRGSTFTVRLPAAAAAATVAGEAREPEAAAPGRGLGILVVDDNRDSADSLASLLRIGGHLVKLAYDGPEALRALAAFRPHLILLDLGLPGMTGYEVARRIRSSTHLRGVTLAALTGWGQAEDRDRTREAGFDHHLVKPADPDELGRIVAALQREA